MDFTILNESFEQTYVIDTYDSSIWTDRLNTFGDFELYIPASADVFNKFKKDYYLIRSESEKVMIINDFNIQSNVEEGDHVIITGESLESLLKRRIIWESVTFEDANLQESIESLLNSEIINPKIEERKINNFIFKKSEDPSITNLKLNAQYYGDNLYDVISNLCIKEKIGFKITLSSENNFIFELYRGLDRSYRQETNPYVIFSQEYENIISSDYKEITKDSKNVALVMGEDQNGTRKTTTVGIVSGIKRKEYFSDARDISKNQNGTTISDAQYIKLLAQRGEEDLDKNKDQITFEGQAETTKMFVYKEDFFIGDIVQISDSYGHYGEALITEIIFSKDKDEVSTYPTFEMLDKEEEVEE